MWQLILVLFRCRHLSACGLNALFATFALGLALLFPGKHPLAWILLVQLVALFQCAIASGQEQNEQRLMLHSLLPLRRSSIAMARLSMSWIVLLAAAVHSGLLVSVLAWLGRTSALLQLWQASLVVAIALIFCSNYTYLLEELNLRVRHSRLLIAVLSFFIFFLPFAAFYFVLGFVVYQVSPNDDIRGGTGVLLSALWEKRLGLSLSLLAITLLIGAWSLYLFRRRERLDLRTSAWLGMETIWGGR